MEQGREGKIMSRIPPGQHEGQHESQRSLAEQGPDFDYWRDWRKMIDEKEQRDKEIAGALTLAEHLMRPLEDEEKKIWVAYGLDGEFDFDMLFKECQRRAYQSSLGASAVQRKDEGSTSKENMSQVAMDIESLDLSKEVAVEGHGAGPPVGNPYQLRYQKRQIPLRATEDEKYAILLDNLHSLRLEKFRFLSMLKRQWGVGPINSIPDPVISDESTGFWAVVIGIDDYGSPDIRNLGGAVADAKLVYEYLRKDLGVPEFNIKLLTSDSNNDHAIPTRAGILNALYSHLRDNPNVAYGDNIFIYFAGYGSLYRVADDPFFTSTAGKLGSIEAICPADRGLEQHLDNDHTRVVGIDISDRELNIILSEIKKKHGKHITVILDCCHSGGMARAVQSEPENFNLKTRYVGSFGKSLSTMLAAADCDPRRRPDSPKALDDKWRFDMSTHVIIGPCKDIETANEDSKHGLFTAALITALRSSLGRNPDTTYSQLIGAIKMRFQTPVIAGLGKKSTLWFQNDHLLPNEFFRSR